MNDSKAERAILAACYQAGLTDMLMRLDREDFLDPLHVVILCELKNMVAAGEPLDDIAITRWFSHRRVVARARSDGIKESIVLLTVELLTDYATSATVDYYFKVLRIERLRRAIHRLSVGLEKRNKEEDRHPLKVLDWAAMNIEKLQEKVVA